MKNQNKEVNGRTRETEKIRLIREDPSGYFAEYKQAKFGFSSSKPSKKPGK